MSEHTHAIDYKQAFIVEELPGSQVKLSGELPFAEVQSERTAALTALGKDMEIDGFRKGHIPEPILIKQVGEMRLLTEMAERAIAHAYQHIVLAHELDVIGQPEITVTKIAPDNPLGFTLTVAVVPPVALPDYADIAKAANTEKATTDVTDTEVEEKIQDILRQKAAYERLQQKAQAEKPADIGEATTLPTPENEAVKADTEAELEIPELTDEVAQSLGQPGQFSGVEDLKTKLKEHLTIEKERDVTAAHRAKITDAIIEKTEVELPKVLIDSEIGQMFSQMQEDLDRANLKFDDYLTHIKKTKEELAAEWQPAAEKRAKLQLVLNEIAKQEDITPDTEELTAQTAQLMERFKDADEHRVRLYVASVLTNEAVMKFLESK
jgi:trigger factor